MGLTHCCLFNSLFLTNRQNFENDQIQSTADDILHVGKMMISFLDREENTVEKGENAGYQHFLLFPQCFPKLSSSGLSKIVIVW